MPQVRTRLLWFYRHLFIALANAGVTWIILIIAPLGLFSVILCTAMVALGSFVNGLIGDLIVRSLLVELPSPQVSGARSNSSGADSQSQISTAKDPHHLR